MVDVSELREELATEIFLVEQLQRQRDSLEKDVQEAGVWGTYLMSRNEQMEQEIEYYVNLQANSEGGASKKRRETLDPTANMVEKIASEWDEDMQDLVTQNTALKNEVLRLQQENSDLRARTRSISRDNRKSSSIHSDHSEHFSRLRMVASAAMKLNSAKQVGNEKVPHDLAHELAQELDEEREQTLELQEQLEQMDDHRWERYNDLFEEVETLSLTAVHVHEESEQHADLCREVGVVLKGEAEATENVQEQMHDLLKAFDTERVRWSQEVWEAQSKANNQYTYHDSLALELDGLDAHLHSPPQDHDMPHLQLETEDLKLEVQELEQQLSEETARRSAAERGASTTVSQQHEVFLRMRDLQSEAETLCRELAHATTEESSSRSSCVKLREQLKREENKVLLLGKVDESYQDLQAEFHTFKLKESQLQEKLDLALENVAHIQTENQSHIHSAMEEQSEVSQLRVQLSAAVDVQKETYRSLLLSEEQLQAQKLEDSFLRTTLTSVEIKEESCYEIAAREKENMLLQQESTSHKVAAREEEQALLTQRLQQDNVQLRGQIALLPAASKAEVEQLRHLIDQLRYERDELREQLEDTVDARTGAEMELVRTLSAIRRMGMKIEAH